MIAVKNLHKSFGSLNVLDGLDIQALDQGIFAILGPNGSGKTTLIKCILGMVIPDKGSIQINGKEVLGEWAYRGSISYMPQIANFPPNLKVIELINQLYEKNYILIYTARFMGRNNDNIKLANKEGYNFTLNQIKKWGLKFHKLKLGKPTYDIFVDDKSFGFNKNWLKKFRYNFKKEL